VASWWGRLEIVQILLQAGADIMIEDVKGRTAAQVAGKANGSDTVKKAQLAELLGQKEKVSCFTKSLRLLQHPLHSNDGPRRP
jgi:hypothetical protein